MPDAVAGHARAAMMSASTIEHSRRPGDEGIHARRPTAPAGAHCAAVPPKLSPPLLTEREPQLSYMHTGPPFGAGANSMSVKALAIQIGGYVLVGAGSPVC
jgi:hypothetical protein